VERLLHERGVAERRFAVLHPGNAGSAMNWAAEQYAELGRRLAGDGLRIVVTGGPSERDLSARVARAVGSAAVDLGGATSLPELAALLHRAALYAGSSTGPAHLAAAVGTPVIALFSPLRSSAPARWRPLGTVVQTLQPALDLECPRCLRERCPHWQCMHRHLRVEAAHSAARRILGIAAV
jgi:ADP-heptose:LPS heptosyltransferase